jgi:hypothetical protein
VLPHPQIELSDDLWHWRRGLAADNALPAEVLDEVPNRDHHDLTARAAAKARRSLTFPTAAASSKMPLEPFEQVAVHPRDVRLPTAQPYSKMKDRTKRSFGCQRAVAQEEALLHESVEELAKRLLAQPLAELGQKEGTQAGSIM